MSKSWNYQHCFENQAIIETCDLASSRRNVKQFGHCETQIGRHAKCKANRLEIKAVFERLKRLRQRAQSAKWAKWLKFIKNRFETLVVDQRGKTEIAVPARIEFLAKSL